MDVVNYCLCCDSTDLSKSPAVVMPFVTSRIFGWDPIEITEDFGLRDIKNGTCYQPCQTLQCNNCGFVFMDIRYNDEEQTALYKNYRTEEYTVHREKFEKNYRQVAKLLDDGYMYIDVVEDFLKPHIIKNPMILDFGGDTGKNTLFLKDTDKPVHIFDVSDRPIVDGAKRVMKSNILDNEYDLIICSQVLEHISYPITLIQEILSYANNNTIIYLEVPYEEIMLNEDDDIYQKKNYWHEHISFFSKSSLVELITKAGAELIDIKDFRVDRGDKKMSILSLACKKK